MVSQDRIRQLISALEAYDPERIILFGSHARGDADEHSDLDVAIIKETDERFLDRLGTVFDLLPPIGAVDVLVYTPTEFAEMQARGNPSDPLSQWATWRRAGRVFRPGRR